MVIIMKAGSTADDLERVLQMAEGLGLEGRTLPAEGGTVVAVSGDSGSPQAAPFEMLPGVAAVLPIAKPLRKGHRAAGAPAVVRVGGRTVGEGRLTLISGPCAVESEEQLLPLARRLARMGADFLRGGAYKPRSSPYDFQGMGEPGLRLLAQAGRETGLPVITEAVDERSLESVARYADVVQIGARNMQNFSLLKAVGRGRLPVFLKRGLSASLEEWLLAAEYILDQGNPNVMLCERGIRTFSSHSRFTLDISVIPQVKRLSRLPVFVDPSHASGVRESVAPLARAAVAAGADGVMVEVHPDPSRALCDGRQSLTAEEFGELAAELRGLSSFFARPREEVS